MLLYEYQCRDCADRFEVLQRMGDDGATIRCPSCEGDGVERRFSTFAAATGSRKDSTEFAGCGQPRCCASSGGGCDN